MTRLADEVVEHIYGNYHNIRFAFVYIADVKQNIYWCVKGHPLIEHKSGFGNVLRSIADKLDKMYEKRYGTLRLRA